MPEKEPASTGGSNTMQPGFDVDRDTQSPTPQGGMQQGQQSAMPPGTAQPGGASLPGQQGAQAGQESAGARAMPQGAQGAQPGGAGTMGGTATQLASINEREACDLLMTDAMLHTEAIEGGVAIVARPRRNVDVSAVRDRMQSIHRGIESGGPASATASCELFALGRDGVASLIETPDSIRLLVTTNDASRVPQLRRRAVEFMRSKGGPASRGATPQGGKGGGGTPHPSDEKPQPATP